MASMLNLLNLLNLLSMLSMLSMLNMLNMLNASIERQVRTAAQTVIVAGSHQPLRTINNVCEGLGRLPRIRDLCTGRYLSEQLGSRCKVSNSGLAWAVCDST